METGNLHGDSSENTRYFVGGIPPFLLFETEFHSLFHLVESHAQEALYQNINPATKAAIISLVAHFEAFSKHQFAALVNIWPPLLQGFATQRPQAAIPLRDLATVLDDVQEKIGFVVAEHYDFGSATQVNGLFRDLLNVTPFSSDDTKMFDSILIKRHLLVHHAGYYTLQHLKKHAIGQDVLDLAFKDAVVIGTDDYHKMGDFLFEMAMKITRATVGGFNRRWKSSGTGAKHPTDALQKLLTGLWDNLDQARAT